VRGVWNEHAGAEMNKNPEFHLKYIYEILANTKYLLYALWTLDVLNYCAVCGGWGGSRKFNV